MEVKQLFCEELVTNMFVKEINSSDFSLNFDFVRKHLLECPVCSLAVNDYIEAATKRIPMLSFALPLIKNSLSKK